MARMSWINLDGEESKSMQNLMMLPPQGFGMRIRMVM